MYDKSRQTDPSMDIPVFMNTLNAHLNTLLQVFEQRFTDVDNKQDRIEKIIHSRLDQIEKDIHNQQYQMHQMHQQQYQAQQDINQLKARSDEHTLLLHQILAHLSKQ